MDDHNMEDTEDKEGMMPQEPDMKSKAGKYRISGRQRQNTRRNRMLWIVLLVFVVVILAIAIGVGCTYYLRNSTASWPGLRVTPQPEASLIQFSQGDPDTYNEYVENLNRALEQYSDVNQESRGLIDCDPDEQMKDPASACKFPISTLGSDCIANKDYGYHEGQPCVLLTLDKVLNWTPEPLSNESIPEILQGSYKPGSVGVTCEGQWPPDIDNVGIIQYYPVSGFGAEYFPYTGQDGYLSPLVMVQFRRIRLGILAFVECKLWAGNIAHNRNNMLGSVQFEILMD